MIELTHSPRQMTGAELGQWIADRGMSLTTAAAVMAYDKAQLSRWVRGAHQGSGCRGAHRVIPRHVARKVELIDALEEARAPLP